MTTPLIDSLIALSGQSDVVVVRKPFVQFTGSLEGGILLGQLLYWTPRARIPGGWIAKTDNDFSDELCLSSYAVRKARKQLEEMGILETKLKRFNGSPTVHYRLRLEKLQDKWTSWIVKMDLVKSQNPSCEIAKSLTETTPETTTKHVADATPQPSPPPVEATGEELITQYFGPKEERKPVQATPHWTDRVAERWTEWGEDSAEMHRQIDAFGERGRTVQRVGYELDQQFGLRPLWDDKKAVKSWMSGISKCLDEAGGDEQLIFEAAKNLIEADLSIASPWSLQKKTAALAAKKRRDDKKPPLPYSDEWYAKQMEQDVQAEAFR